MDLRTVVVVTRCRHRQRAVQVRVLTCFFQCIAGHIAAEAHADDRSFALHCQNNAADGADKIPLCVSHFDGQYPAFIGHASATLSVIARGRGDAAAMGAMAQDVLRPGVAFSQVEVLPRPQGVEVQDVVHQVGMVHVRAGVNHRDIHLRIAGLAVPGAEVIHM